MKNDIVSIILTSYNHGQWVRQSIESVLQQTYPHWELIVIDNGSTDNSPSTIEEYAKHPQVRVIRYERNSPLTIICNDAIRRARGKYFSLLHSDDYYLPGKLERQVAAFGSLPDECGVVYSTGFRLMQNGDLRLMPCGNYKGNILEALLTQPQFFMPIAPLARRECLLRYPFNERLFWEGEGIYAKIALSYPFYPLPAPLVVMREHENNQGKHIGNNLARNLIMYEEIFKHPDFPDRLLYLRESAIGGSYRVAGLETIRREGNYQQGSEWLRLAIRHNPRLVKNPRVLAGLVMSLLPRALADACNNSLNRIKGAPPPVPTVPPLPVEGCAVAERKGPA